MLAQSLLTYRTVTRDQEAAAWTEHTHSVIALANAALTELVNMETGYRGFLVTGRDEFLEPYRKGDERFRALIEELVGSSGCRD